MTQWQGILGGLGLLVTVHAAAAQQAQGDSESPRDEAAESAAPDRSGGSGHEDPPPATTFTPSERIGADSAVSFPVDI
jgi:hypothetical protein